MGKDEKKGKKWDGRGSRKEDEVGRRQQLVRDAFPRISARL